MDAAERKQRGIPKLRELLRRQRHESDNQADSSPEIDFVYDDADEYFSEISELYTYTEEVEFILNKDAYEGELRKPDTKWMDLSETQMKSFIYQLLDKVESAENHIRVRGVRTLLYLAQGVFGDCESREEHRKMTEHNIILMFKCGAWPIIVQLLNMEIEDSHSATAALRKPAVSLADSINIRLYISFLYSTVETMRCLNDEESEEVVLLKETFAAELNQPIMNEDNPEILPIILFKMVVRFCAGNSPHFPIRKVLLLLWKTLLVCLGGFHVLEETKQAARVEAGLPAQYEEPELFNQGSEILLELRPRLVNASPPPTPPDVKEGDEDEDDNDDTHSEYENRYKRRLKPKVRQKDVDAFLDATRIKFLGFQVRSDRSTLAGLPLPIHEGVDILKNHVYVSLGEVQIKNEEEAASRPFTKGKMTVISTPTELLYQAMLPNLPQCMIALLKILLAAAPTAKAKSDSLNILSDVLPEEMPTTVLDSMRLGIDVNRHKEIIVKAISGTLILLLKHFKLNHVYQFEYMGQHLVFANCIPLILKFLNQNIASFISAKNNIPQLDFPNNVIGEPKVLTADNLEFDADASDALYCWRNLFSCINLVRVLQKLTKWKHSRTMMLVVFKSAPILKRALKVKHDMLQLYVLKLLKAQTKYLGRNWRKSNMKTMSAIYQKVRHRLNDDWAYGNDLDARPWDFQAEECALRTCVDRFNSQRYGTENQDHPLDPEFTPVDNNVLSVLSTHVELSDEFKTNYEKWLDREVFNEPIDWDQLLDY